MRRIVGSAGWLVLASIFVVLGLAAQEAPAYAAFGMTCRTEPATGKQICDGVPGGVGGTILIIITVIAIVVVVLNLLGGASRQPKPGASQFGIKAPPDDRPSAKARPKGSNARGTARKP